MACRGTSAILTYHRVLPAREIRRGNHLNTSILVSQELFERQIRYLVRQHQLVAMDDLPQSLQKETGFRVAITFDDGYKDNLAYALPVLKQYQAPATVYVTTRFPEGDSRMWWYELADICQSRRRLDFIWKNQPYRWGIDTLEKKRRCYDIVQSLILSLPDSERPQIMALIRKNDPIKRYPENCLTWKEIRSLSLNPLITIGAHTLSHARLRELSEADARKEIRGSKELLEQKLGCKVAHFSYPYGSLNNFGNREVDIVAQAGFATAVTGQCEHVGASPDLYRLPRIPVDITDTPDRLDAKLSSLNFIYGGINKLRTLVKG